VQRSYLGRGQPGPGTAPSDPAQVTDQTEYGAFAPWTVRTASGELFRIDGKSGIVQFAPDGSQRRLLGRKGEGPGEFRSLAGGGVLPGDSLVAFVDPNRGRLLVFGVADGGFRREIAAPPAEVAGQQWHVDSTGAVIPIALGVSLFMRWEAATDSIRLWGEPTEFRRMSTTASMMSGEPSLARDGEGWLALLPGEATLVRYDTAGRIIGRVPLPRRARKGELPNAMELLAQQPDDGRFSPPSSMAMGLHRLPDGRLLVVHLDVEGKQQDRSARSVELTSIRWWATIFAADLRTACVDLPIPFTSEELSRVLFAGDTVMTVSRLVGERDEVRTELQRVRVDPSQCAMVPVSAPTP
jgi:hypothetical protein